MANERRHSLDSDIFSDSASAFFNRYSGRGVVSCFYRGLRPRYQSDDRHYHHGDDVHVAGVLSNVGTAASLSTSPVHQSPHFHYRAVARSSDLGQASELGWIGNL